MTEHAHIPKVNLWTKFIENLKKYWGQYLLLTTVLGAVVGWVDTKMDYYVNVRVDAKITALEDSLRREYEVDQKNLKTQVNNLEYRLLRLYKAHNLNSHTIIEEMDTEKMDTKFGFIVLERTQPGNYRHRVSYDVGTEWELEVLWFAVQDLKPGAHGKTAWGYYEWGEGRKHFHYIKQHE